MSTTTCHRIVIAAHAWSDDLVGGAFKVATDWARYLVGRGHEVHYLCGGDPAIATKRSIDGVQVWCYPYPEPAGVRALHSHLRGSRDCFRRIRQEVAVDAIAGHSPLQYLGALWGGGRQVGTRMYSVHSPFVDEVALQGHAFQGHRLRNLPRRLISSQVDRRCISGSTVATTFSRFTLDRLTQLYGRERMRIGKVRSAWVDTKRFQAVADRHAVRRQLGGPWDTDLPVLLSLRRLEPRMGLDRLVEAARMTRDAGHPFRLLIGGSGSMLDSLQQQIEREHLGDSVFLLGRVPESDLTNCYASADCFLLPTTSLECFGLIILEAYASGVPVIATPVGAIPEIVSQISTQWLTKDATAEAIAERMTAFLGGDLRADSQRLRQLSLAYDLSTRAAALESLLCNPSTSEDQGAATDRETAADPELLAESGTLAEPSPLNHAQQVVRP